MEIALIVLAAAFAVFTGMNDGGAMLAASLRTSTMRPLAVAGVFTATVVVAPTVVGTQVATTLANRLVTFQSQGDQLALALAVFGAITVVAILARGGLPTSLTLALIGGILGVGIGGGLPVAWSWVVVVLLLAAAAPLAGLAGAYGLARVWGALPLRSTVGDQARRVLPVCLLLQAVAYGSNDGQKMLAVFALAVTGGGQGRIASQLWTLLAIGVLFALGMLSGVRRYGMRLGSTVRTLTPMHTAGAQLSAALTVTGTAAASVPVSMTQSISGALIGSGLSDGVARVRWGPAIGIVLAWALTLPIALLATVLPAAILVRP